MSENKQTDYEFEELQDNYDFKIEPAPIQVDLDPIVEDNRSPNKTLSVISMVLGIVSCACTCIYFAPGITLFLTLVGIASLILAIIAKKKERPNGISTAGLICGISGIAVSLLCNIFWLAFILYAINDGSGTLV